MQAYLAHFVFQKGRGHSAFLFWDYKMCQISLYAGLFGTLEYNTVKLGDKERFDKEQIGVKRNHFQFTS